MRVKREIWKDIDGYEGRYQVSSLGRVASLLRLKVSSDLYAKLKLLKPHKIQYAACPFCGKRKNRKSRIAFDLRKDGSVRNYFAHYLVAKAFIPNTLNKPCVIHLDMDSENNSSSNLQWATHSEASLYRSRTVGSWGKSGQKNEYSRKILQYYLNGKFKRSFYGACEASRITKIHRTCIVECLTGSQNTAGGFIWKYAKNINKKKKAVRRKECKH